MRVAILFNAVEIDQPDHADVLEQVAVVGGALRRAGHEVIEIACDLDLGRLWRRLAAEAPDAAFNLVESLGGRDRFLPFVPALLEELSLPFTGSGSLAATASGSKLESKRRLAAAGVPVLPCAAVWPPALEREVEVDRRAQGPFIAKSVWIHGSSGLDDATVVGSRRELAERLPALAERLGGEVVVEPYLHGREFNLSLMAHAGGVEVLPAAEIVFDRFPAGKPHIVGYRAKWDPRSFEYRHTLRRFDFGGESEELVGRLRQIALRAWHGLGVRGYARVDFRVSAAGEPFVLEVNANPCLSPDAGFAAAVERSGRSLEWAVGAILDEALQRRTQARNAALPAAR